MLIIFVIILNEKNHWFYNKLIALLECCFKDTICFVISVTEPWRKTLFLLHKKWNKIDARTFQGDLFSLIINILLFL